MEGMLNYFVPEDGDSSDHLNVVPLPRVDQLRLQHIKKSFPLPGDFHFRFKTAFEGTYVWLDVVNDNDPVPDFNGVVISKIARVQRDNATRPPERVETKAPATSKPAPDLIETSMPEPAAKRDEKPVPQKAFNDDLVGLLADPIPPQQSPRQPPTQPAPSPTPQSNAVPQDPFNFLMGGAAATTPMRPAPAPMGAPRGPPTPQGQGFPGGNFGGMGGPSGMGAPRPQGGMGISQMGPPMGMNHPNGGVQAQNSFQGLSWQGMGQAQGGGMGQQPPRPGMPMQPNARPQW